jgi:hypothetical protein
MPRLQFPTYRKRRQCPKCGRMIKLTRVEEDDEAGTRTEVYECQREGCGGILKDKRGGGGAR